MKKDTFYFSHDYNARNDRKMIRLRQKLGVAGIGAYWCVVEMLYEEGGKIAFSEVPFIAEELRMKEGAIDQLLTAFDLFSTDGNFFWSDSVQRRLDKRLEKSEKAKASATQRWSNPNAMRTHTKRNAIKESKGKEKKVFIAPSIDDVKAYFKDKGYRDDVAALAFEYYDSANWHDKNGDPVTSWKQKMIANWFKPENKIGAPVRALYAELGATGTTGRKNANSYI